MQTDLLRAAAAALCLGAPALAQAQGFDPRMSCTEILQGASEADRTMVAAWAFGYVAAASDNVRPVDPSNNRIIVENIAKICTSNPQASLLAIVKASAAQRPAGQAPAAQAAPGSEAEARALLARFVAPGADHLALTQALLPTEAEVKALYAEPLGSALWADYAAQMGPGVSFAPKPGQSEVLVVHTTTRALFDRQPVLDEFPGGYKDVLQYLKVDVPIVRFKFVEPGKTLGLAFDGLVHINGRWVIMPKPWRSLPG